MQRSPTIFFAALLVSVAACTPTSTGGGYFDDDASVDAKVDADDAAVTPDKTSPVDVASPDAAPPDVSEPDVPAPMDVPPPDVAPPDVTCADGLTNCGGTCFDLQTTAAQCGACGNACTASQVCIAGSCVAPCTTGQTRCAGACVSTQTDNNHCGMCGNACPAGQRCEGGGCAVVCAADQTRCGAACVNTLSDGMHCGGCGIACPATQMCASGVCVTTCAAGETLCNAGAGRPGSCANLMSNSANCGSCNNACPAAQMCVAGACACPAGQTLCGGLCVDAQTDNSNCGACGRACPGAQTCTAGACACPAGLSVCGTACVNTATDVNACGRCGISCGTGEVCVGGLCSLPVAVNDTCASATVIDLTSGPALTITGSMYRAMPSANSCSAAGADVFYQFTLTAREAVYFDTFGTPWNTVLGLQRPGCAAPATACVDDSCATAQSQLSQTLDAGTYLLVVDQAAAAAVGGDFTLHVQHFPVGNGPVAALDMAGGPRRLTGTTAGTGVVTTTCCSGGPENAYVGVTCPTFAEQTFRASTCGLASFDTELDFRSGNRATATVSASVCNDDGCGLQSLVTGRLPGGAGLHVLYADGCGSGAGAYSIDLQIGDCTAAQTLCGAVCVDTQTDAANCGTCGNACAAGTRCFAGRCGLPTRYTVAAAPAGVTFTDACVLAGAQRFVAGADDAGALTAIPFAFRYWDRDFVAGTQANVCSNGWLGFGYTTTDPTISTTLPSTGAPNAVAALWMTDLYAPAAGVCVATTGTAPNRRWITSWTNATNYSSRVDTLNFSLTLHETTNLIDIAYGTLAIPSGRTPSAVGLENVDGSLAVSHCATGTVCTPTSGTAFRYTPAF